MTQTDLAFVVGVLAAAAAVLTVIVTGLLVVVGVLTLRDKTQQDRHNYLKEINEDLKAENHRIRTSVRKTDRVAIDIPDLMASARDLYQLLKLLQRVDTTDQTEPARWVTALADLFNMHPTHVSVQWYVIDILGSLKQHEGLDFIISRGLDMKSDPRNAWQSTPDVIALHAIRSLGRANYPAACRQLRHVAGASHTSPAVREAAAAALHHIHLMPDRDSPHDLDGARRTTRASVAHKDAGLALASARRSLNRLTGGSLMGGSDHQIHAYVFIVARFTDEDGARNGTSERAPRDFEAICRAIESNAAISNVLSIAQVTGSKFDFALHLAAPNIMGLDQAIRNIRTARPDDLPEAWIVRTVTFIWPKTPLLYFWRRRPRPDPEDEPEQKPDLASELEVVLEPVGVVEPAFATEPTPVGDPRAGRGAALVIEPAYVLKAALLLGTAHDAQHDDRSFDFRSYVFIQLEPEAAVEAVVCCLLDIPYVIQVAAVFGDYDLIALIRTEQQDQREEVIGEYIRRIPGIATTTTNNIRVENKEPNTREYLDTIDARLPESAWVGEVRSSPTNRAPAVRPMHHHSTPAEPARTPSDADGSIYAYVFYRGSPTNTRNQLDDLKTTEFDNVKVLACAVLAGQFDAVMEVTASSLDNLAELLMARSGGLAENSAKQFDWLKTTQTFIAHPMGTNKRVLEPRPAKEKLSAYKYRAYVLIEVAMAKEEEVLTRLQECTWEKGRVIRAHAIFGSYDAVAVLEATSFAERETMIETIRGFNQVISLLACTIWNAYSEGLYWEDPEKLEAEVGQKPRRNKRSSAMR